MFTYGSLCEHNVFSLLSRYIGTELLPDHKVNRCLTLIKETAKLFQRGCTVLYALQEGVYENLVVCIFKFCAGIHMTKQSPAPSVGDVLDNKY